MVLAAAWFVAESSGARLPSDAGAGLPMGLLAAPAPTAALAGASVVGEARAGVCQANPGRVLGQAFVANRGQWPARVRDLARCGPVAPALEDDGLEFVGAAAGSDASSGPARAKLVFDGGGPVSSLEPADELPGRFNYFLGNDRDRWATDVPAFGEVTCRQVCP